MRRERGGSYDEGRKVKSLVPGQRYRVGSGGGRGGKESYLLSSKAKFKASFIPLNLHISSLRLVLRAPSQRGWVNSEMKVGSDMLSQLPRSQRQ